MKKWVINYILFVLLLVICLIQAISGFLLWLVIPGGHRGFGLGQVTGDFIWSRFTWIEIHDWTAISLVIVVIIHIILHWKWILETTKRLIGIRK
jgi:cytochrome b561